MFNGKGRNLVVRCNPLPRGYGNHNCCFFLTLGRIINLKSSPGSYDLKYAQHVDGVHGVKEDLTVSLGFLEILNPAIDYLKILNLHREALTLASCDLPDFTFFSADLGVKQCFKLAGAHLDRGESRSNKWSQGLSALPRNIVRASVSVRDDQQIRSLTEYANIIKSGCIECFESFLTRRHSVAISVMNDSIAGGRSGDSLRQEMLSPIAHRSIR